MRKSGSVAILLFAFAIHAYTQTNAPVFRGLVLNETTHEAAIKLLGPPHKNEMRDISAFGSASKAAQGEVKYLISTYKKLDEWKEIQLTFYESKLIGIRFFVERKRLEASSLPIRYNTDFVMVEGFAKGTNLSVFDGQKDPVVPRVYPLIYYMVSAQSDRFIVAAVASSNSWNSIWLVGKATEKKYPGYVGYIDILSRKFETDPNAQK